MYYVCHVALAGFVVVSLLLLIIYILIKEWFLNQIRVGKSL